MKRGSISRQLFKGVKRAAAKVRPAKAELTRIQNNAKRKVVVNDPKALEELRQKLKIKAKFSHIEVILTNDGRVFLVFGKKSARKYIPLSESQQAIRIVKNVLDWDRLLNKTQ